MPKKHKHESKHGGGGRPRRNTNKGSVRPIRLLRQAQDKKAQGGQVQGKHTAVLRVTARGVGFAELEHPLKDGTETVRIEPGFLNTALHRDRVEVVLYPKMGSEEQAGEVANILFRYKMKFVGTVKETGGGTFVEPDDQKMYEDILLEKKDAGQVQKNQKVYVEITKWTDPKLPPLGTIVTVLGKKGDHDVEMKAVVLEQGLSLNFPKSVEKEAEQIPHEISEEEIGKRRDIRSIPTFTIDPETAKDFDDALSVRTTEDGDVEIGIHIADVTHFVSLGSAIDNEAARRATSIYLVDRTIPMLPEVLSNDLCSLNPKEDKLAFSAMFTFSGEALAGGKAKIINEWFGRTVIVSDKRFSYEDAQGVLDTGAGEMEQELKTLSRLAQILRKERFERGAIAFERDEVRFELDKNGKPLRAYVKERQETNKLVEDFMLLANKRVAEYISKKDKQVEQTFVYRVHDVPDADKVRELSAFLKTLGYDLKIGPNGPESKDINALLNKIHGSAEEGLIQAATIRAMAKAIYSTKNIGHYGLSFSYYTHFTSPIRRYPDMMVHRLLATYLADKKPPKGSLVEYEAASRYSSEMEHTASVAERNSIKYKQVEYMSTRIGETFTGVISGVVGWGLYVEEKETKCEGLIHIKNLGDDFYTLDEKTYSLRGEKTKKRYRLGDEIKIRVKDANLDKRVIDYELAG